MKIKNIETLHCDAGWRPWTFIKIETDKNIIGYSECTDSNGSPLGITGVVETLKKKLIGEDPRCYEKLFWKMYSYTRQNTGGIIQKSIGGIENALLDIKAKDLNIPVFELFGGPIRDEISVYWSHCGTTRARAWEITNTHPLNSYDAVRSLGKEVIKRGFSALKTNVLIPGDPPYVHMPGFGKGKNIPDLNLDKKIMDGLEKYISTLRDSVGSNVDIILDVGFNFKTEGYIKIAKRLEQYDLLWLEIDTYDPDALLQIKNSINIPICSCEDLYTTRDYRPFFIRHAMDIASIDILWNGFAQSKKIADMAELYEMNITTHNYYSHLATFISSHFCSVVPNLKIMETDIDDVPWKDKIINKVPKIHNGKLTLDRAPGWGVELNEEVIREHPWPQ